MALIACPACGRQISAEANACPKCGHPNRAAAGAAVGPQCYACEAPATTRCQRCGTLSCAQHLQSIFVSRGDGGAYELRCRSCYSEAEAWNRSAWVFVGIALVIGLVIIGCLAAR
jgi:hypothetical protein